MHAGDERGAVQPTFSDHALLLIGLIASLLIGIGASVAEPDGWLRPLCVFPLAFGTVR